MKCYLCKKGNLVKARTSLKLFHGKVVVDGVPCEKCAFCGEEFISEEAHDQAFAKVQHAKKLLERERAIKSVSV
ncbi:MAG: YgiT-type zinc finger protein [Candidatus Diapherotrites archaeon]